MERQKRGIFYFGSLFEYRLIAAEADALGDKLGHFLGAAGAAIVNDKRPFHKPASFC